MEHLGTYSFLEEYRRHIEPKIVEIDTFLKTTDEPLRAEDVAEILEISKDEVAGVMKKNDINTIDRQAFLQIMMAANSRICGLYSREVAVGSPHTYTGADIAYIYNLDPNAVEAACKRLKIKEVTAFTMPLLFAQILI